MSTCVRLVVLSAVTVLSVHARFELFRVVGNVEIAVPSFYDIGSNYAGEPATIPFRLRNTAGVPATLTFLRVDGAGFTLAGPSLPSDIAPMAAVAFSVTFQAAMPGSYSAALNTTGLSVLLFTSIAPALTYTVAERPLTAAPVDFGSVPVGSSAILRFTAANQTTAPLMVPAIGIDSPPFSLAAPSPSGSVIQPGRQTSFDLQFAPANYGSFGANLMIGDRSYPLIGSSPLPPPPKPILSFDPEYLESGQQGTVAIKFDAPAKISGSGTLELGFIAGRTNTVDITIRFADGTQSAPFTFNAGDTQARFGERNSIAFQAGTSAGNLAFGATIGESSAFKILGLNAMKIVLQDVRCSRQAGQLLLQVVGFDNTRSSSHVSFTFFDSSGQPVPPGEISSDQTYTFGDYYSRSNLGGLFRLSARFPVNGDAALVRFMEVQFQNILGWVSSGKVAIP